MSSTNLIENKIRRVAKKQGVIKAAIGELVVHAAEFRIDDAGKIRSIAEPSLSIKKFVKARLQARPEIQGEKKVKAANPFLGGNSWNVTAQAKIVRQDPALAARLAEKAGVKVGAIRPAKTAA